MRLNLKATGITLDDSTRSYLHKRLQSIRRIIDVEDPAVIVDVELGRTTLHRRQGDIFFAEINIHRGKEAFRAVSDRENLFAAIDAMRDDIARELSSRKGKEQSMLRRSGQAAKALFRGSYEWTSARLRGIRIPKNAFRPWQWIKSEKTTAKDEK